MQASSRLSGIKVRAGICRESALRGVDLRGGEWLKNGRLAAGE